MALKMGIKERERRVEVFFYGLFMDEELLRGKGLEPEGGEIAAIDGFALRIGQRAALVPTPDAKVYGSVFSRGLNWIASILNRASRSHGPCSRIYQSRFTCEKDAGIPRHQPCDSGR